MKLNEEATRYLQDFPEEMIFHTSNLHMLDIIGQGKKKGVHMFPITGSILKFVLSLTFNCYYCRAVRHCLQS